MKYFKKRQKVRRLLFSRVTLGALVILIFFALYQTWDVYRKYRVAGEKLEGTQEAFGELEERQTFLEDEIERLSTDEGMEEEMRRTFGVAKDGEGVIILVDGDGDDTSDRLREEYGLWGRMRGWFE